MLFRAQLVEHARVEHPLGHTGVETPQFSLVVTHGHTGLTSDFSHADQDKLASVSTGNKSHDHKMRSLVCRETWGVHDTVFVVNSATHTPRRSGQTALIMTRPGLHIPSLPGNWLISTHQLPSALGVTPFTSRLHVWHAHHACC